MASGKNVSTFAVPAMRPLVLYLFVRSTGKISKELNTQREVHLVAKQLHIHHRHEEQLEYNNDCNSYYNCHST